MVTQSLKGRDEPSILVKEISASGEIVTGIKLVHGAIGCGTIRTLEERYLQVFETVVPWGKAS